MLATRSRQSDIDEEERVPLTASMTSGVYTDTSLFEGLSFPEVPISSVRREVPISSNNYRSAPQTDSHDMEMVSLNEPSAPSAPSAPTLQSVGEPISHPFSSSIMDRHSSLTVETTPAEAPAMGAPSVKGSLSTLYASAEIITAETNSTVNYYPEVPSLSVSNTSYPTASSTTHLRSTPVPLQQRSNITVNSSPTVQNPLTNFQTTGVSQQQQQPQQDQAQSTGLVDELLQENSRLTQEVQHLRSLVAQQPPLQSATSQPRQQQQPQQYLMAQTPATGTQVTDTSNPPAAGVKYVCCGSCRQWLLAPNEAVYVVCSRCQAVNNCNLTPLNLRRPNGAPASTALYNSQSDLPWYLDCFTRPFRG